MVVTKGVGGGQMYFSSGAWSLYWVWVGEWGYYSLHGMFVPAPMEWLKWNLSSGGVIECGSQTPQVHRDVKLPWSVAVNEGRLEDVWVLKFLIINLLVKLLHIIKK